MKLDALLPQFIRDIRSNKKIIVGLERLNQKVSPEQLKFVETTSPMTPARAKSIVEMIERNENPNLSDTERLQFIRYMLDPSTPKEVKE